MFYGILIGAGIALVLFIVVVSLQSSSFRITRSARISAPPASIFPQVNDLHNWRGWSPWENVDPDLKRTYEGPLSGTGAIYRWLGNKNVGEGNMTITESRPNELIRIRLEFIEPFAATNTAEFIFKPEGDGTVVTWSMTGDKNFMAKAFHLFMNMDKMIGGQFEIGLANLKGTTEKPA